ncbi:hypothetical protein B9Z19DRAFT_415101 [Tuber borchii]|uniref:Uncharacterized protein n=1 Tax=Tuber borchii TaxID=42251 RepID=A0A2T7A3T7_TUBBO|nr:hypothetical protein B9Z19DRAFT_415101 [Tuber borchii]
MAPPSTIYSISLSAKPLYFPSFLLTTKQRTVSKSTSHPIDYTINTDIPFPLHPLYIIKI